MSEMVRINGVCDVVVDDFAKNILSYLMLDLTGTAEQFGLRVEDGELLLHYAETLPKLNTKMRSAMDWMGSKANVKTDEIIKRYDDLLAEYEIDCEVWNYLVNICKGN